MALPGPWARLRRLLGMRLAALGGSRCSPERETGSTSAGRAAIAPGARATVAAFYSRLSPPPGGLPSRGRERAVAYVICSTGGARDETNFPPERIADLTEAEADELLWWDEIDFVQ